MNTTANRVSREICRGPNYRCMFCGQCGDDVVWEYDEDARQLIAMSCDDVDTCADRQAAQVAHEEGRRFGW